MLPRNIWREILKSMQAAIVIATYPDGTKTTVPTRVSLDIPTEVNYCDAGGIIPYFLNQIVA